MNPRDEVLRSREAKVMQFEAQMRLKMKVAIRGLHRIIIFSGISFFFSGRHVAMMYVSGVAVGGFKSLPFLGLLNYLAQSIKFQLFYKPRELLFFEVRERGCEHYKKYRY